MGQHGYLRPRILPNGPLPFTSRIQVLRFQFTSPEDMHGDFHLRMGGQQNHSR